ncbi:MAG: S1 RNA-binding domain-containing protein [Acidobacteriota bacterium]
MTQAHFPDSPDATSVDTDLIQHDAPVDASADMGADAAMDDSFGDILSQFERGHHAGGERVEGTVVSVTPDGVFVDIGRKNDGVLPVDPAITLTPGIKVIVSIRGRDTEGNYQLSTIKVEMPKDWSGLEAAFENKTAINGRVTEAVKGGLRVDVGVRAFMPASRSGVRELADLEKLVGQQIECRITKLDKEREDVVVDRRVILEELEKQSRQEAFGRLQEGTVVQGTVRSLTDFGAFVDIGGIDGLLHVADMSYARGVKPSDVVKPGQQLEVKILKIQAEKRKISLGLKQLAPDPWEAAAAKYTQGARVNGKVTRVADFGAFVQLEPGLEGLIHVSEMSWTRRNVKASDIVKPDEMVDVVVLGVNPADKRIALGLKQALGDPWEEAATKYPVGATAEAPITSLAQFGAFVDLGGGIEGMIHIGDITNEKRLNHPSEVLKVGQVVKAVVVEADKARRRMRLSMKALEPTSMDEFLAENKIGDVVTGRIVDVSSSRIKVELGEGVMAYAPAPQQPRKEAKAASAPSSGPKSADLSSMTALLSAKWKSGGPSAGTSSDAQPETMRPGQIQKFKIAAIDSEKKRIELTVEG